MFFVKQKNGIITAFVSLMLTSVLSLGTLVLEAGRYQAGKTQLAIATNSAATSMIASFDSDLYERYGLLAIDTERFTEERCRDYLEFNSDLGSGYKGNHLTRMYAIEGIEMTGLYNLTYPEFLKRQILSRAKFHTIPENNKINIYTAASVFGNLQNKCDYIADMLAPASNGSVATGTIADISPDMLIALQVLGETFKELKKYDESKNITISSASQGLLPSATGVVESQIIDSDLEDIRNALNDASNVLGGEGTVLQGGTSTQYSEIDASVDMAFVDAAIAQSFDVSNVSNMVNVAKKTKAAAQGIKNALNTLSADKEGNILLNSYISQYFSNRNYIVKGYTAPAGKSGVIENGTFAAACTEYIFGGNASERVNQEVAYNYVYSIYFINNLYATLNRTNSYNRNSLYSIAAHIAWASYETLVDMELLTKYNVEVPFNKSSMILDVNSGLGVAAVFASKDVATALTTMNYFNGTTFVVNGTNHFSYKDCLALALWFVPNSTKMLRLADLVQLEMRYREQYIDKTGAKFLMSEQNTYCRVKTIAKFNSILPIVSIGTNSGVNDTVIQSIKYAGY